MKTLLCAAALILNTTFSFQSAAAEAKELREEPLVLSVYDVSDIVAPILDYPSPAFHLSTASVTSATANADPFKTPEEPAHVQASDIAALLRERLLPTEFADPATAIEESSGRLVVMQRANIHALIVKMIQSLRENTRPQVAVKAVLAALPQDPDETYYDEAALTKLLGNDPATILASPRLICYSGQRAHVLSGRESNAVIDLDISGHDYDPVVTTLLDGHVLDVRPLLSADRSSTELALSFRLNSNVKRTLKSIGFTQATVAFSPVALPAAQSAESSGQKFAPAGKKAKGKEEEPEREVIEEHKSSSSQDPGRILGNQYISRVDMDSVSMDSSTVQTQLSIPAGKWALAGTVDNPDVNSPQKHLQLFVTVEALGK